MRKNIILLCVLFLGAVFGSHAQQITVRGFYFKTGASYFIKVTPVEFPEVNGYNAEETLWYLDMSGSVPEPELLRSRSVTGSFGQGRRFSVTPGFKINSFLAFELGLHYYKSNKYTMMSRTILDPTRTQPVFQLQTKGQVEAFDMSPSLVLSFGNTGKLYPYTHIGIIVPLGGHLDITSQLVDPMGLSQPGAGLTNITLHRTDRIVPRPTIGFKAALGASYNICEKLSVFAETEYRNISVSSKEKKTLAYAFRATHAASESVVEQNLDDLTLAQRKAISRRTITPESNVPGHDGYDPNKPADEHRSYINIGGLGITAGIRIDL